MLLQRRDAKAGFNLVSSRLQVTFTSVCVCQSTTRLVSPHCAALWNVKIYFILFYFLVVWPGSDICVYS